MIEPVLVCFLLYIIDSPMTDGSISSSVFGLDEKLGECDALQLISTSRFYKYDFDLSQRFPDIGLVPNFLRGQSINPVITIIKLPSY